jgi:hypothetical protein
MYSKRFRRKLNRIRKQGERYKKEQAVRDAYAEYWPEHKKSKTSNIMLLVSIIAIIGYVIADYILQYNIGVELSPTITPYWFGFWTSEIFLLAGIKVSKVIKPSSSDEACG